MSDPALRALVPGRRRDRWGPKYSAGHPRQMHGIDACLSRITASPTQVAEALPQGQREPCLPTRPPCVTPFLRITSATRAPAGTTSATIRAFRCRRCRRTVGPSITSSRQAYQSRVVSWHVNNSAKARGFFP